MPLMAQPRRQTCYSVQTFTTVSDHMSPVTLKVGGEYKGRIGILSSESNRAAYGTTVETDKHQRTHVNEAYLTHRDSTVKDKGEAL